MPTEMHMIDELATPDGLDAVGVLQVLVGRGDVVLVLDGTDEVAGFYEANYGEHDDLIHIPPEFRWEHAAKLGNRRLRNRGDSVERDLDVDAVLPEHVRQPAALPPLESLLAKGSLDAAD